MAIEAFLAEWAALPLFGGRPMGPLEMQDRLRNTVEGLSSSLRLAGTGAQGSLWPRLRELNMPVLALAGANDAKFAAVAEQIANAVPAGRFALIPDAAHAAHLQQPQTVTEHVEGGDDHDVVAIDERASLVAELDAVSIAIVGDAGIVLEELLKAWKAKQPKVDQKALKAWWAEAAPAEAARKRAAAAARDLAFMT